MLEELHIKNLALIEEAFLELGPGLTVLSGETGAGKTVLLSALKLIVGARADLSSIRVGAEEALVEARFFFPKEDREIIATRTLSSSGRSRATLDGSMAPISLLDSEIGPRIDLHGQHDHQKLLRPQTHVELLDAYGSDEIVALKLEYQNARLEFKKAESALEELRRQLSADEKDLEANRLMLEEIEAVDPKENEDEELEAILPGLVHAEEICAGALHARDYISSEEGAALKLSMAIKEIEPSLDHHGELEELYERLNSALIEISDISESLYAISDSIEYDQAELDRVQLRLSKIDSLKKRFGPSLAYVLERRDALRSSLLHVVEGSSMLEELEANLKSAKEKLVVSASKLQEARKRLSESFSKELEERVANLALEHARFSVEFKELEFENWSAEGPSDIEILYSSSAISSLRPLSRIASGGEISRVMLALKSMIGEADSVDILVFDEIDAGIGGGVATAVGRRLAEIAKTHQIIVVTHLAQVAAFANTHYVVRRVDSDESTETLVFPVEGENRQREIARMLSGSESETSLTHARELIEEAKELSA